MAKRTEPYLFKALKSANVVVLKRLRVKSLYVIVSFFIQAGINMSKEMGEIVQCQF